MYWRTHTHMYYHMKSKFKQKITKVEENNLGKNYHRMKFDFTKKYLFWNKTSNPVFKMYIYAKGLWLIIFKIERTISLHIDLKALGEATGLTLIAPRHIDDATPVLFAYIVQIPTHTHTHDLTGNS